MNDRTAEQGRAVSFRNNDEAIVTTAQDNEGATAMPPSPRPATQNDSAHEESFVHLQEEDLPSSSFLRDSCRSSMNMRSFDTSGVHTNHSRMSSLELRKLPPEILLVGDIPEDDESLDDDKELTDKESSLNVKSGLLNRLCLNPRFELRKQLLLSFGTLSVLSIFFVVVTCVITSIFVGRNVKEINEDTIDGINRRLQGRQARNVAESLHHRLYPKDLVEITYQATLDRFAGYPLETDEEIPFLNSETGLPEYPIVGPYLALDWNVSNVVTDENYQEYLQTRPPTDWYGENVQVTTSAAVFHFQGNCNVSETDPTKPNYYPNCSEANNDISTGGVVRPSPLTEMIYRKGADLVPIFKALFEYNQDIRNFGIYFANGGSGATLTFPGFTFAGTYKSVGCDWMRTPNPYNRSKPIGSEEMIQQCRPEGEDIISRHYNPMERGWCRDQALNPDGISVVGPYVDAFLGTWLFSMGRPIYERSTKDFVACNLLDIRVEFVEEALRASRLYPNSEISMVNLDEGGIIASSAWNITEMGQPPYVYQLDIGVTKSAFEFFQSLVDFDSVWEPSELRRLYETQYIESAKYFVVGHPFPPIPAEYDPNYRPNYITLISTLKSDVFEAVEEANEGVDERVHNIILFSVLTGCGGVILAAIILSVMSRAITSPLRSINNTAQRIVGSFGDSSPDAKDFSAHTVQKPSGRNLVPKTEITELVEEFNKMVSSFSGGSLMPRDEDAKQVEVASNFPMRMVFADLYKSRADHSQSLFGIPPSIMALEEPVHHGSNIVVRPGSLRQQQSIKKATPNRFSSPLFLWTAGLIVIPLLLTMIVIAVVSMTALTREFERAIEETEEFLLEVEIRNLNVTTTLQAIYASTQASRSIRDLYVMTRYAGWLLFGGLQLTGVTSFQNVIDECKGYENPFLCPEARLLRVCDCQWNENPEQCPNLSPESRHLLMPYVVVQSDSALLNGTRVTTAFPNVSYTPDTTMWWRSADLPGRSNASFSTRSRYQTSYDRARVIAATRPVLMVLYDYAARRDHGIAQFFAFHDDGMFVGSEGCKTYEHSYLATWRSTEENGAGDINPTLCPLGRYGFDPRCRDWYDSGKRKAHDLGTPLYATAPYVFAGGSNLVGQSFTSALIDPASGYYVGQGLFDFTLDPILDALSPENTPTVDGFPLLITKDVDNFGGDVVLGPSFHRGEAAKPVADCVIPSDMSCSSQDCLRRVDEFMSITKSMKNCETGLASFSKLLQNGSVEKVYIAYAPVKTSFLDPANPNDFTQGAFLRTDSCVYSFGLAETEEGLKQPFRDVEHELKDQTRIAIACLACLIFLAFVLAVLVSYYVTRSITEPIRYILEMIQMVEKKHLDDDLPQIDMSRGSKELISVSHTMETLYEVVRFASMAFYAGELEVAYRVLKDSLRIFRGMDNKKAVSVACNNLGNILLVMYLDMKQEEADSKFGMSRGEIIQSGTAYFHEAIKLGEKAYDEFYEQQGWTPQCLDFMQHLSNRYFNRAIFLLTIKDDHEQPSEIERLGLRDLQISHDMDVEIVDQGEEVGWGRVNRSQKLFQVCLTRVRGLLLLLEMGYPDEWAIEEKLQELLKVLDIESKKESSDLFLEIDYIGRMQQTEKECMKYFMAQNNVEAAVRVAVRGLYEDEYLLAETKVEAIQVLMSYLELNGDRWDGTVRSALKKWLEDSMDAVSIGLTSERQSSVSDSMLTVLSKSLRCNGSNSFSIKQRSMRAMIHQQSCVTMEKF